MLPTPLGNRHNLHRLLLTIVGCRLWTHPDWSQEIIRVPTPLVGISVAVAFDVRVVVNVKRRVNTGFCGWFDHPMDPGNSTTIKEVCDISRRKISTRGTPTTWLKRLRVSAGMQRKEQYGNTVSVRGHIRVGRLQIKPCWLTILVCTASRKVARGNCSGTRDEAVAGVFWL